MMRILAIIGICIALYMLYSTLMMVQEISSAHDLSDEIKKEEILSPYRTYAIAGLSCLVVEVLCLFFSNIIGGVLSVGCFVVCANCLYRLFDEQDKADFTKKDSDVLKDFLKNAERDAKNKSK